MRIKKINSDNEVADKTEFLFGEWTEEVLNEFRVIYRGVSCMYDSEDGFYFVSFDGHSRSVCDVNIVRPNGHQEARATCLREAEHLLSLYNG